MFLRRRRAVPPSRRRRVLSHAHKNNQPNNKKRLARIVGPLGRVRTASTLGELRDIAAEFSERDIDVLAISGGDGLI